MRHVNWHWYWHWHWLLRTNIIQVLTYELSRMYQPAQAKQAKLSQDHLNATANQLYMLSKRYTLIAIRQKLVLHNLATPQNLCWSKINGDSLQLMRFQRKVYPDLNNCNFVLSFNDWNRLCPFTEITLNGYTLSFEIYQEKDTHKNYAIYIRGGTEYFLN